MAFSFTTETDPYENVGRLKHLIGTYTNTAGSTGGDIDTGLTRVLYIEAQPTGAAAIATSNSFNETFPFDGSSPTLVTIADEDGIWEAWGY